MLELFAEYQIDLFVPLGRTEQVLKIPLATKAMFKIGGLRRD